MTLDNLPNEELVLTVGPDRAALFLDFDGVLVELADGPGEIQVAAGLPDLLAKLQNRLSGAMAIVTGRSVDDLAGHLTVLPNWVAGCHGGERIIYGEAAAPHAQNRSQAVMSLQAEVMTLDFSDPGVEFEMKPLGAVVHYRRAPHLKDAVRALVSEIADRHDGFECHAAKMAFELRPETVGKVRVVREWMAQPPFKGRVPIYLGDDLTDEPAMDWVQRVGGIAVKVGQGASVAEQRLEDTQAVHSTLAAWLG
ncbi:MAG: trehalose-phosphatase [Paracoccaceae bacterium]